VRGGAVPRTTSSPPSVSSRRRACWPRSAAGPPRTTGPDRGRRRLPRPRPRRPRVRDDAPPGRRGAGGRPPGRLRSTLAVPGRPHGSPTGAPPGRPAASRDRSGAGRRTGTGGGTGATGERSTRRPAGRGRVALRDAVELVDQRPDPVDRLLVLVEVLAEQVGGGVASPATGQVDEALVGGPLVSLRLQRGDQVV
jgi:hypothetical protein